MAKEDPEYLGLVRRLRCCAFTCTTVGCEAHHPRSGVGMSMRGHDHTAIPLCTQHHRELHSLSGFFKAWDGETLKEWQSAMVEVTQGKLMPIRNRTPVEPGDDEDIPF